MPGLGNSGWPRRSRLVQPSTPCRQKGKLRLAALREGGVSDRSAQDGLQSLTEVNSPAPPPALMPEGRPSHCMLIPPSLPPETVDPMTAGDCHGMCGV